MRLVVTRPEPEASVAAEMLRKAGHEVVVAPMLTIASRRDVHLDVGGIDGLIATSANAIRAIADHVELPALLAMPLHAVGAATADAARRLGFRTVAEGGGTASALAEQLGSSQTAGAHLLHLAGDVVAVDLARLLSPRGIVVDTVIVYETIPSAELGSPLATDLRRQAIDGILLLSPRTAEIFGALVAKAGLAAEARRPTYFCISERTAAGLVGLAAPKLRIAKKPDMPSLLALIGQENAQLPGPV
ncbi:MAG: uroporphyrinogen-III synthase [Hyphomicrobiaceae bacterium]